MITLSLSKVKNAYIIVSMDAKEYIGKTVKIKIDRPMGSKHPKHGFVYPVNYGFVPGTLAPDGEELDAYLLGVFDPVDEYIGKCIAVAERKNDDDPKLIIVPEDKSYSDKAIIALIEFQERFFKTEIKSAQ